MVPGQIVNSVCPWQSSDKAQVRSFVPPTSTPTINERAAVILKVAMLPQIFGTAEIVITELLTSETSTKFKAQSQYPPKLDIAIAYFIMFDRW